MESPALKVLFVDDDADDRFLTRRALEEDFPGLQAREVLGQQDFERALAEGPYDLAITDCSLGWSDGFTVAEHVKRADDSCPVIMFTGSELVPGEMVSRAVRAPVFDFIKKSSTDFAALRAAVRRSQEARKEAHAQGPKALTMLPSADASAAAPFVTSVRDVIDYAIIMLDPAGRVASWNKGAERIHGYAESEMLGRSFETFYTPEDRALARPRVLLEEARETGHVQVEGWRVRKGGGRFWAEVAITAIRGKDGAVTGFCKVCRDVSERKYAADELRRSEQRFRAMIKGVQDYAIYMLDPDGRIISWNTGAELLKGYTTDEILGKHLSVFFPPEEKERAHRLLAAAVREGSARDEGWRLRKDGSRFWADATVTSMHDELGRLTGFAKVTRDLTERKKTETQLQAHAKEMHELNRELELFSSTVSHDLKAPLRQIEGFASILKRRPNDPEAPLFLDKITEGVRRLQSMITDLLQYSMAGRSVLEAKPVDLSEVVARVAGRFESEAKERGGSIRLAGALPRVVGQESIVERMVENLVGNAIKYSGGGKPDVEVRAELKEQRVRLRVEDRGPGVPEELKPRLFLPFQRGHGGVQPGHGLGLAIVRRAAERMGGAAGYEPRAGGGSSFWIELPAA